MRYLTPLRYPGGKSKLADFIKLVFETNELIGGDYAELYAGGASIAFRLLFDGYVSRIHINDLSKSIHSFWLSVLNDTENLSRLITDTPVTMETWRAQKAVQENLENHSTLEIGYSTFFLNRTNRSGILTGGVIGGQSQAGDWTLDARFNKPALIKRIEEIAKHKKSIVLYNKDAADFIRQAGQILPVKSVVYLDPPYYSKGRRLYETHYEHDDHANIAQLVGKMKRKWIVSYDDAPEVRDLYDGYRKKLYKLSYTAKERYSGKEVMFFSKSLIAPAARNPAKIKKSRLKFRPKAKQKVAA